MKKFKKFFAVLLTMLPEWIAQYVTLSEAWIGRWYESNGYYKFPVGTIIALKDKVFGYGVRPIGIVTGYTNENKYVLEIEADKDGNFHEWFKKQYTPTGDRLLKTQIHFKWNIEYHFKKVFSKKPDLVYRDSFTKKTKTVSGSSSKDILEKISTNRKDLFVLTFLSILPVLSLILGAIINTPISIFVSIGGGILFNLIGMVIARFVWGPIKFTKESLALFKAMKY